MAIIGFYGSCPYSIGYHIITHDSEFDPNSIYIGTTWFRIKGRSIVGVDEGQTEFSAAGKLGGLKTINTSHSHTTGDCTLTIAQMPSHAHEFIGGMTGQSFSITNYGNVWSKFLGNKEYSIPDGVRNEGGNQPHNHGNTGVAGGTAQTILNPYISEYIWKRTV